MMDLDLIPFKIEGVMGRIVDGEAVLLLPEKGQVKVLNEVGAFIWSQVDGINTVKMISESVTGEYAVDQREAEQDTILFLKDLEERGVIYIK
jgi:hypothetical protein